VLGQPIDARAQLRAIPAYPVEKIAPGIISAAR
jgi:hypothetical protein